MPHFRAMTTPAPTTTPQWTAGTDSPFNHQTPHSSLYTPRSSPQGCKCDRDDENLSLNGSRNNQICRTPQRVDPASTPHHPSSSGQIPSPQKLNRTTLQTFHKNIRTPSIESTETANAETLVPIHDKNAYLPERNRSNRKRNHAQNIIA